MGAQEYADEQRSCQGLTIHTLAKHRQNQWAESTVIGDSAHTNRPESFFFRSRRTFRSYPTMFYAYWGESE